MIIFSDRSKRTFSKVTLWRKSVITLLGLFITVAVYAFESFSDICNHRLYYTSPATIWEETLPLGNGRLGMMPDGGIMREHIVLNEISLWSGMEADYANPEAAKTLPAIRQLIFEGRNKEAQKLMYSSFVPKKEESDARYGSYQLLGNLYIDFLYDSVAEDGKNVSLPLSKGKTELPFKQSFDCVSDYRRELSLRDAVAYTSFVYDGIAYKREYFVSADSDVMLIHLTSSVEAGLNFSAYLNRPENGEMTIEGNSLVMSGTLDSGAAGQAGMKYRLAMRLLSKGGKEEISISRGISLKGGEEAWLVLSAATSYTAAGTDFPGENYVAFCDSLLMKAEKQAQKELSGDNTLAGEKSLKDSHITSHRSLYERVSLTLPIREDDWLPTNERILRFAQAESPALAALYYNFGRYLLISSTRPGSLPPNLQGLWANDVLTPWNGDYHTNINIEMNHWGLEQAGLSELYQPLTTFLARLVPSGERSAKAFYGDSAEGWVLHMMTNVWNYTAPGEHPSWGATNTGGAWLCVHLWEHYLYTQDKDYLLRIYPLLKGATEFFRTTMVREPSNGWLVTAPTSSPENSFYMPGDTTTAVSICMGPTMDVQLLTELYTNVIEAAKILNVDALYALQLMEDLRKFPPMQISKHGYLQEWLEDYREVEVNHRHVSHLYGLHPGNMISPDSTPALAEASRVTLNRRGDEGTGWSRAWKINFWARLADGERAWKLFKSLLHPAINPHTGKHEGGTFPNLFCSHPPFQIDGNFGGAAGVGEMLLHSHEGFINLLPALPESWNRGMFNGMRVRGGAAVDLEWNDSKAVKARIKAFVPNIFTFKMPKGVHCAEVKIGDKVQRYNEKMFAVELHEKESCDIYFY